MLRPFKILPSLQNVTKGRWGTSLRLDLFHCPSRCSMKLVTNSRLCSMRREQQGGGGDNPPYIAGAESLHVEGDEDMWRSKPPWCQPWTIVTTGVLAISIGWALFNSPLFTSLSMAVIFVWWYLFLFLVPTSYAEAARQMKKGHGQERG